MVRSRSKILFCAIARNGIVVTHSASSVGNFSQLTNSLLKKMASDLGKPSRKIFSHADLLFHCVSTNSGLVAPIISGSVESVSNPPLTCLSWVITLLISLDTRASLTSILSDSTTLLGILLLIARRSRSRKV